MSEPEEQPPTDEQLLRLIDQYRAGLDAEIAILHQLADAAQRQGVDSGNADADAFHRAADERDRLMQGLVTIEADLRPVRAKLSDFRAQASRLAGFADVAALHRNAAQLAAGILSTDQQSMRSLADAEVARRSAVAGIERGETTLAAYRRVLTPPLSSPTLVDRRG
jgi:hypothetical protein